jgi:capsule polysaccharide export protein KpsE/RkpR
MYEIPNYRFNSRSTEEGKMEHPKEKCKIRVPTVTGLIQVMVQGSEAFN